MPELAEPGPQRAATLLAAAFAVAAGVCAAVRAADPFDHGWWLVAYLFLVGGLAQLLLTAGRDLTVERLGAADPRRRWRWWELGLWNVGTIAVPAGVLTGSEGPVVVGSVLLLAALGLFTGGLRASVRSARQAARRWTISYHVLVAGLAASVVVGTGLAGALPWQ